MEWPLLLCFLFICPVILFPAASLAIWPVCELWYAPLMDYELYFDESNIHPGARCLYIGGLWIPKPQAALIRTAIADLKTERKIAHELKWDNVSKGFLPVYTALVDIFLQHPAIHFRCSFLDKRVEPHKALYDRGIDHAIHAVTAHAAAQGIDPAHRYWLYVDRRNVGEKNLTLERLREDIQQQLQGGEEARPIRHIEPRNSKKEPIIQLADVLLGALAYIPNNLASTHTAKYQLCAYMAAQLNWPELPPPLPFSSSRITIDAWAANTKKAP